MKNVFGMAAALCVAFCISNSAQADVVLNVDLTVTNEITITSTAANSSGTVSGSITTGFYLASIFNIDPGTIADVLVGGDLTSFNDTSSNTPDIATFASNFGLNVFDYSSSGTGSFTAGSQAFSGSATWTLNPGDYAELLSGNLSGDVYFPADGDSDLAGATIVGQWSVIPEPGALALLGALSVGCVLRRRRTK